MADAASTEPLDAAGDGAELEYRTIEPWAVVSMLLGFVSPVAFIAPVLWLVPILGALAAWRALVRLRRAPERSGRPMALLGLALSVFCVTAPIARAATARVLLGPQARFVSDQFIEYLLEGSPEKAVVLHFAPDGRPPIDNGLWTFIRSNDEAKKMLRDMVDKPAIRMLLELGKKANVRFFRTNALASNNQATLVDENYTVTFLDKNGKKKTILLGVLMERKGVYNPDVNPWRVRDFSTASVAAPTAGAETP